MAGSCGQVINGCFIVESSLEQLSGVNKKIENQIKAFEKAGFSMRQVKMDRLVFPGSKVIDRLPFANCSPQWKLAEDLAECDFIYMRKPWLNGSFIRFLKKIKKRNPKAKVIVEFPTYPYDGEMRGAAKDYPKYAKDLIARKRLRGCVDRICSLVDDREIFGIGNIQILNGYDFSQIRIERQKREDKQIRLCCVANFARWHGYERLLKGLAAYYRNGGERDIQVYMVGEGSEISSYKKIADDGNIGSRVEFYGQQDTDAINEILNRSDFGMASLGLYKADFFGVGCFLKTREYLAAGLPVICGSKLDIMEMDPLMDYILEFPNDESEIDVNKIVEMYDRIYQSGKKDDIHMRIRESAEKRLDMSAAMEDVIKYIKETAGAFG